MIYASATQFHIYLLWFNTRLAYCLNRFLNVKGLVGAFNQVKVLLGALSVIVKLQTSRKFVSSSSIQASHCSRTQVNLAATPAPSTNPPNPGRWWSGSPRSVTFYNVETNPILLVRQSTAVNFVHSDDLLEETRE